MAKKGMLFTERSPVGQPAAALVRNTWQIIVAIKHRRELARLADRDDRMLADIGLTRRDLHAADSAPLWRDPTSILERHASR